MFEQTVRDEVKDRMKEVLDKHNIKATADLVASLADEIFDVLKIDPKDQDRFWKENGQVWICMED